MDKDTTKSNFLLKNLIRSSKKLVRISTSKSYLQLNYPASWLLARLTKQNL